MTVKKAIQLIDWWKNREHEKIADLKEKWFNTPDVQDMAKSLIIHEETVISNLETIKKQLATNCEHPKKMRDKVKGQPYCMACNMDL